MTDDLTKRERDVLQMIWDGLDTKEIANALGISFCWSKNLQDRLRIKLNARSRVLLVRRGLELGLIQVRKEQAA